MRNFRIYKTYRKKFVHRKKAKTYGKYFETYQIKERLIINNCIYGAANIIKKKKKSQKWKNQLPFHIWSTCHPD